MAAAQERWTILAGIPNVVNDEEADRIFRPGTDSSVAYNDLPSASVLTVPARLTDPPSPSFYYPYIAAADPSGLLLLCARNSTSFSWSLVTYHLCDARTGEVISLCRHRGGMSCRNTNIGVITRGKSCVVAELQARGDGTGRATLLTYTVGEYRWVEMELAYSPPLHEHSWIGDGVVSHDGMLWFVDLSYGILACDPFADDPELLHVPLPRVPDELPAPPVTRGAYRCVKVSGGRLVYVQIHGSPDAPVVSTWSLAGSASAGEWNPERSVRLANVWADESYLCTMLPRSIPALAFLHPADPDRAYFFLGSSIFAVDLRRRVVVEFSEFRMPDLPADNMASSLFVHAWQYDPSSSRPSDFVPTCLRNEQEFAAMRSLYVDMCRRRKTGTLKTARKLRGSRNSVSQRQLQVMRRVIRINVFKKRGVSKEDLNRLASLTMNG